eukprot:TRINITY_DN7283_c0_g1_i1.p1 TRINITY_DN7283_c0_g1~~TRINITY_DN7283_c0_g1_i1.p1  ORF type:complete len:1247 (-),score=342.65 TRINITY_DN7283_c0_g1_i1:257-3997(-)
MQPLPTIPKEHGGQGSGRDVACQGPRKERAELVEKAKAKQLKLEGFYDFSEALEPREALKTKILNTGKKLPQHPADDQVVDWMRNERQRAEDRAEKKWKKKFEEWQKQLLGTSDQCALDKSESSGALPPAAMVQDVGARSPSPKENEESLIAMNKALPQRVSRQKLFSEVERLTRSLGYNTEELREERQKRLAAETNLEEALTELEIWRGKTLRREAKNKELLRQRKEVNEQLRRMNDTLSAIGAYSSGATLEEVTELFGQAQMSSDGRNSEQAARQSAAIKIQGIARRRAAKKRTAAIKMDRKEDEEFANVLGIRPSTPAMHQASEKARREALREEYHKARDAEAARLRALEMDKAAVRIQNSQRQKAAREKVRQRRAQILAEKANKEKIERRRMFQKAREAELRREELEKQEEERQRQRGLEEAERQRKAEESRFKQEKAKEEAIRRDVAGFRDREELTAAEREEESEAQRLVAQMQAMRAKIEAEKQQARDAVIAEEEAKAAAEAAAKAEAERIRIAAEEAAKAAAAVREAMAAAFKAEVERARIEAEEERARIAAEEAERVRIAEEAERARIAAEEAERARVAAEEAAKAEAERIRIAAEEAAKAEAERVRIAAEEAERARAAAEAEAEAERARAAAEAEAEAERARAAAAAEAERARAAAAAEAKRSAATEGLPPLQELQERTASMLTHAARSGSLAEALMTASPPSSRVAAEEVLDVGITQSCVSDKKASVEGQAASVFARRSAYRSAAAAMDRSQDRGGEAVAARLGVEPENPAVVAEEARAAPSGFAPEKPAPEEAGAAPSRVAPEKPAPEDEDEEVNFIKSRTKGALLGGSLNGNLAEALARHRARKIGGSPGAPPERTSTAAEVQLARPSPQAASSSTSPKAASSSTSPKAASSSTSPKGPSRSSSPKVDDLRRRAKVRLVETSQNGQLSKALSPTAKPAPRVADAEVASKPATDNVAAFKASAKNDLLPANRSGDVTEDVRRSAATILADGLSAGALGKALEGSSPPSSRGNSMDEDFMKRELESARPTAKALREHSARVLEDDRLDARNKVLQSSRDGSLQKVELQSELERLRPETTLASAASTSGPTEALGSLDETRPATVSTDLEFSLSRTTTGAGLGMRRSATEDMRIPSLGRTGPHDEEGMLAAALVEPEDTLASGKDVTAPAVDVPCATAPVLTVEPAATRPVAAAAQANELSPVPTHVDGTPVTAEPPAAAAATVSSVPEGELTPGAK